MKNNAEAKAFLAQMEAKNYPPRIWAQWDSQNDEFIVVVDSEDVKDYARSFRVKPNGIVTEVVGERG